MDIEILQRLVQLGPRGSGRTHSLCEMCNKIPNAVVIVAQESQAEELRPLWPLLEIYSFDALPEVFRGPVYFDHGFTEQAVTHLIATLRECIDKDIIRGVAHQLGVAQVEPKPHTFENHYSVEIDDNMTVMVKKPGV